MSPSTALRRGFTAAVRVVIRVLAVGLSMVGDFAILVGGFAILLVEVVGLAIFIFWLTPIKLPPALMKEARKVEADLISHSASSGFASFKFLEQSVGNVVTHYCVLDGASDPRIVNDYARQNGSKAWADEDTFIHFSRHEYWSVVLLNDNSWQILMANECVSLTGSGGRCAPIASSVLRMIPAGTSDECPNGRFTIGLED